MDNKSVTGITPNLSSKPSQGDCKTCTPVTNVGPQESSLGGNSTPTLTVKASPIKK